ncbi:alpha/beta-hydrolase [Rhizodiscina lignyota]|uniref:Alpha/beta-hydrolase n=1 Tax=Rhizodiscina lignyota TaxID=1504668 RepID=A0A9P4IKA0_9PEZI|nr:alpha/beta-hydrolase [Rhizodiscina lignyota]
MATSKPTILFAHGAFHTPESFSNLASALEKKGYHCPNDFQLPSIDAPSSAAPGLLEDAQALRQYVLECIDGTGRFESQGPNDCVVVMHSYGGAVGSQALEGLGTKQRPGKKAIKKLVYINANIVEPGDTVQAQMERFGQLTDYQAPPDLYMLDGQNVKYVGPEDLFYNDIDPESSKTLYAGLKPTGFGAFLTPLTGAAYRDIPSWALVGDRDNCLTPKFQEWELGLHKGYFEHVEHIDGGHFCFIPKPAEVAEVVDRAATAL